MNITDRKVNIKETVTGHIEQLMKKFERYHGETLTPTKENEWIIKSIHSQPRICLIEMTRSQIS